MKWISISWAGRSKSGKTNVHTITSNEGGYYLGTVKWHGPWRKYVFLPGQGTIFEQDCLRDIAQFCEESTRAHRKGKA